MRNSLSDVITCNTSENFTYFSSFFPCPYGAWKNTKQLAKYLIAFYFKPSNEMYCFFPIKQLQNEGENLWFERDCRGKCSKSTTSLEVGKKR